MDSGATAHMASDPGMLHYSRPSPSTFVTVGNGSTMPTSHISHVSLPASAHTFSLNNVLIVPNLVKNLISIRRFTTDNWCSTDILTCMHYKPLVGGLFCAGGLICQKFLRFCSVRSRAQGTSLRSPACPILL
jgi:hypothetical protein